MRYNNYLKITDTQYYHIEENIKAYKDFNDEQNATPKIIIGIPNGNEYTTPQMINSPEIMLKNTLDTIQTHIDIGDDYIPQARVEFGTGQVSHAFGCGMYIPEDSPVCAKGHVLNDIEDIEKLELPPIDAGWFGKVYEFTKYFMDEKPDIVGIQIPDLQSPFNNAHLIRGNDILYDFYDSPEHVDMLLKKVTDYQLQLTKHYRQLVNMEDGYFYDWGTIWKGGARLSNCSLHMISTQFYEDFIKNHDINFFNELGGGRIHYCGSHDDGLIDSLCSIKNNSGLDLDGNLHNLWEMSDKMPKDKVLLTWISSENLSRIYSGDAPSKRNIVLTFSAKTVEEGRQLYKEIKNKF